MLGLGAAYSPSSKGEEKVHCTRCGAPVDEPVEVDGTVPGDGRDFLCEDCAYSMNGRGLAAQEARDNFYLSRLPELEPVLKGQELIDAVIEEFDGVLL